MRTKAQIERARSLRREQTPPEGVLWSSLRNGQLGGLKFRRQYPIGPYVLDFYCFEARLCVEIDSVYHDAKGHKKDQARDAWLRAEGIDVLRVSASDVSKNLGAVLRTVLHRCQDRNEQIKPGRMRE